MLLSSLHIFQFFNQIEIFTKLVSTKSVHHCNFDCLVSIRKHKVWSWESQSPSNHPSIIFFEFVSQQRLAGRGDEIIQADNSHLHNGNDKVFNMVHLWEFSIQKGALRWVGSYQVTLFPACKRGCHGILTKF